MSQTPEFYNSSPDESFQAIIDSQFGAVQMATDTEIEQMERLARGLVDAVPGEINKGYGHETEQGYLSFRTRVDEEYDPTKTQSTLVVAGGAFNEDKFMLTFGFHNEPLYLGLPGASDEELVIDILKDLLGDQDVTADERAIIEHLRKIMDYVRGGINLDGLGKVRKSSGHIGTMAVGEVVASCVNKRVDYGVRAVEHSIMIDEHNKVSIKTHELVGTTEAEDLEDVDLAALMIRYEDLARGYTYDYYATLLGDREFSTTVGSQDDEIMKELDTDDQTDLLGTNALTGNNIHLITSQLIVASFIEVARQSSET